MKNSPPKINTSVHGKALSKSSTFLIKSIDGMMPIFLIMQKAQTIIGWLHFPQKKKIYKDTPKKEWEYENGKETRKNVFTRILNTDKVAKKPFHFPASTVLVNLVVVQYVWDNRPLRASWLYLLLTRTPKGHIPLQEHQKNQTRNLNSLPKLK